METSKLYSCAVEYNYENSVFEVMESACPGLTALIGYFTLCNILVTLTLHDLSLELFALKITAM